MVNRTTKNSDKNISKDKKKKAEEIAKVEKKNAADKAKAEKKKCEDKSKDIEKEKERSLEAIRKVFREQQEQFVKNQKVELEKILGKVNGSKQKEAVPEVKEQEQITLDDSVIEKEIWQDSFKEDPRVEALS